MLPEILNIIHEYYEEDSLEERFCVTDDRKDQLRVAFPEVTKKIFKMDYHPLNGRLHKKEDCVHVHKLNYSTKCSISEDQFDHFENLADLELCAGSDVEIIYDFSKLKKLKRLCFCRCVIKELEFPEELETLIFWYNYNVDFSKISIGKKLRKLRIFSQNNQIIPSGLLEQLEQIEYLQIIHSKIESFNLGKKLEVLDLRSNGLTNCNFLNKSLNLVYLDLSDNKITDINVDFPDSLEILILTNNKIKPLDGVKFPTSLEELYLESNNINVSENFFFGNLKILELSNCGITDSLVSFLEFPNFFKLYITGNKINRELLTEKAPNAEIIFE